MLADIRPELLEGIAAHSPHKPQYRAQRRIANRRLTVCAPRIGDKVIARNRDVARVSGPELALSIVRHEGRLNDMADASSEGLRFGSHVAGILAPDRAYARFQCVA